MPNTGERIKNTTRHTGDESLLDINPWQAGFMLSGILLFTLGVAFYFGTAIGAMITWLMS